jgi:hypothetical protein
MCKKLWYNPLTRYILSFSLSKAGKRKGDPAVGKAISEALASVPNIDPVAFDKMFNDTLQVYCELFA